MEIGEIKSKLLENCTAQYCCLCKQNIESDDHYTGKPHEKLLQLKLKIMLRKNRPIENSGKRAGDSEDENPEKGVIGTQKKKPKKLEKEESTVILRCDLCGVTSTSKGNMDIHLKGLKHIERVEAQQLKQKGVKVSKKKELKKETKSEDSIRDDDTIADNIDSAKLDTPCPGEVDESPANKPSENEGVVLLTENEKISQNEKKDSEVKNQEKDEGPDNDEASSDDDLIILEDPYHSGPPKKKRNTQKLNNTPVIESIRLCMYPLDQSERVTVSTQDYASLEYDTFLNDIIIDFYLLYLANDVLQDSDRDKVHIFSTMFYKRLLQEPRKGAKQMAEYETDKKLTNAEKRHCRVAGWTKNVDLFEKDMLIIPICEESHWYLLLVVRAGMIFSPFNIKERKEKGEPFFIVLDSMKERQSTAVKNIRRYLAVEWNKKKCGGVKSSKAWLTELDVSSKRMSVVRPKKPEQENSSDCGIFLLHYVEKIFEDVSAFTLNSKTKTCQTLVNSKTKDWFTSEEVGRKRGEIAELIRSLTAQQKPGEDIVYPKIKFTKNGIKRIKKD